MSDFNLKAFQLEEGKKYRAEGHHRCETFEYFIKNGFIWHKDEDGDEYECAEIKANDRFKEIEKSYEVYRYWYRDADGNLKHSDWAENKNNEADLGLATNIIEVEKRIIGGENGLHK